jgi:hypothetical protein
LWNTSWPSATGTSAGATRPPDGYAQSPSWGLPHFELEIEIEIEIGIGIGI